MLSVDALNQTALFVGISPEAVAELWSLGSDSNHQAGELLFERGGEARDVLVLESGAAELFFPLPVLGVTKDVIVERVGPGDVLAWSALISPFSLTLSGRCTEACVVRRFVRRDMKNLLEAHPRVGYTLMENLAAVVASRLEHFQNLWIREIQMKIVGSLG